MTKATYGRSRSGGHDRKVKSDTQSRLGAGALKRWTRVRPGLGPPDVFLGRVAVADQRMQRGGGRRARRRETIPARMHRQNSHAARAGGMRCRTRPSDFIDTSSPPRASRGVPSATHVFPHGTPTPQLDQVVVACAAAAPMAHRAWRLLRQRSHRAVTPPSSISRARVPLESTTAIWTPASHPVRSG